MNKFKNFHPLVNLAYFASFIGFSMFLINPICLAVGFVASFVYSLMLNGKKACMSFITFIFPLMLVTSVLNPLFSHSGTTILCYFPNGNPLTLESILYGVAAAFILADVICIFSCFNQIMTGDKLMYLFGKIIPALSLVISMTLRFVPKFKSDFKDVCDAQKCLGRDISDKNIKKRIKIAVKIISVMITQSLENAIDTAESMKSRGFGLPGRTAYSNYTFTNSDKVIFSLIVALTAYVFCGVLNGKLHFAFFPSLKTSDVTLYKISLYCAYGLLCTLPPIIEIKEELKWKKLKSKI